MQQLFVLLFQRLESAIHQFDKPIYEFDIVRPALGKFFPDSASGDAVCATLRFLFDGGSPSEVSGTEF